MKYEWNNQVGTKEKCILSTICECISFTLWDPQSTMACLLDVIVQKLRCVSTCFQVWGYQQWLLHGSLKASWQGSLGRRPVWLWTLSHTWPYLRSVHSDRHIPTKKNYQNYQLKTTIASHIKTQLQHSQTLIHYGTVSRWVVFWLTGIQPNKNELLKIQLTIAPNVDVISASSALVSL